MVKISGLRRLRDGANSFTVFKDGFLFVNKGTPSPVRLFAENTGPAENSMPAGNTGPAGNTRPTE